MKTAIAFIHNVHVHGRFCRLLITLTNKLDPDHDRQNVGLDLDPNPIVLLKEFSLKNLILKKKSANKILKKIIQHAIES